MKEQIELLISRLLDKSLAAGEQLLAGVTYDSSKTVAFRAAKEIDQLNEDSIEAVMEIAAKEKNKDRRSEAYSILRLLAKKYNRVDLIYFIFQRLAGEKDKNLIGVHLNNIPDLKTELTEEFDTVLQFAKRKEWQIRHGAVRLLAHYPSRSREIEELLIPVLQRESNEFDLLYANSTLAAVGTMDSVEPIKNVLLQNNKVNVLSSGIYALGRIDGANQVDFFIQLMAMKKDTVVKAALNENIARYGDERAIPVLIDRVKKVLAKPRTTNMHYIGETKPEIVHALAFLKRYQEIDPKISPLFDWVINKRMDMLDETEKKWVEQELIKE